MNYFYRVPAAPMYYYQRNPYAYTPNYVWPQQNHVQTAPATENKGNICAYVSDQPVHYHPLNITQWPSEDYNKPHPKGFLHTNLLK